ncbi:radical SAM protein [bacterium]|nr:radical SAM protein [candidate division CSSED10-310 bacterium]
MFKIPDIYRKINDLHAWLPKKFGRGYALPPLRVGCVLTHRCNLKCSMCFVWKHGSKDLMVNELTTSEWLSIFEQIPTFSIITFTGGEPLVRKDFNLLIEAACKKHRVHLVTNGTLADNEDIERFIRLSPKWLTGKGLLSVGVSLEGPQEVHDQMVNVPGAFDKTTTMLRKLAEAKRKAGIKYPLLDLKIVICRETHGSLLALYDIADNLGLDIISYQQCSTQESSYGIDQTVPEGHYKAPAPVEPIDSSSLRDELHELIHRAKRGKTVLRFNPEMPVEMFVKRYQNMFPLKEFTCSAAWSIMHIGPYGTVYPCFSIPMGNLRETSLAKIWNGIPYREFRNELKEKCIYPGCIGCCVMKKR